LIWDKKSDSVQNVSTSSSAERTLVVLDNCLWGCNDCVWIMDSDRKRTAHGSSGYLFVLFDGKVIGGNFSGELSTISSTGSIVSKKGHDRGINCFTVHSFPTNGVMESFLFSGSDDSTVRVWDKHLTQVKSWNHKAQVYSLVGWLDHIFSGGMNCMINMWNFNGDVLKVLNGHSNTVRCLYTWKNKLFSGSRDYNLKVWNEFGDEIDCIRATSEIFSLGEWDDRLLCGCGNGEILVIRGFKLSTVVVDPI